tara:strand:- start:530 stop:997 length:468 start_codon:yes stop_codon:yes gene_type:complete
MAYESSTTTSVETTSTNTSQATTSTYDKNSSLGIQNAIDLRRRLGKLTDFFDRRLLGDEYTPRFQFNAQEYDLIYGELLSTNVSKLSAEILAYEVLALSKWYNEPYDKILPFVFDGKLTINNDMLKRLNYTRPSNNKLGITINTPTKDLQKELVD